MSKNVYKWNGSGYIPSVPMRDLSEAEWEALSDNERAMLEPHYQLYEPPKKRYTSKKKDNTQE